MTERLDIMDIEPDFSHHSNFNDKAGVAGVKFGADAPVLEVELNELQQIQDLAREDLIRSMIPSGFTKVPEIDFFRSTLTTIVTANDAEAYVNGMRIFIPKGTVIDVGEAPEKESREDLIFLEVWKEEVGGRETLNQYGGEGQPHTQNTIIDIREKEETSHRIINKWRIRHVADVDFETHPNGLRVSGEIWNPIQCYVQGKNDKPLDKVNQEDSIYYSYSIFSQYTDSSDWKGYNYYKSDHTLAIAGCFNSQKAKEKIGSVDGLAFAIPMFKLQRRPKSGFKRGSYDLIAPTADPVKVNNVVKEERVAGVSTGEVDMRIEGRTLKNLINYNKLYSSYYSYSEGVITNTLKSDTRPWSTVGSLSNEIKPLTKYTIMAKSLTAKVRIQSSTNTGKDIINLDFNEPNEHQCITFVTDSNPTGLFIKAYSTAKPNQEVKIQIILIEGEVDYIPKPFSGIKSSGEDEVAFREFINYPCTTIKGQENRSLAKFPYKFQTNLIKLVMTDEQGKEFLDGSVAYELLAKGDEQILWKSCDDSSVLLTNEQLAKVEGLRLFCNTTAKNSKISGFNIYDGYSIKYVAKIDEDRETIKEFRLKEPLRGLPNGVCDTINKDGIVVRRIGKLILNGQEEWQKITSRPDTNTLFLQTPLTSPNSFVLCNNMPSKSGDYLWQNDEQGIGTNKDSRIQIRVNRTQLNTQDVEGFKKWLKDNPLEVYYEKKLYEPLVELQNGVTDVDNRLGEVTRYSNTVICNGSEDWTIDLGATQSLNLMRFSLRKHDRLDTIDGHSNLMDLVCPNIPVANDRGSTPPPRLWNYWKDTIYLDITPTSLGINFNEDNNEAKLSKFKSWLNSNPITISYQLAQPIVEKYEIEKAEVMGDLYFNNENAEIISKNNIPPELTLKHKANMNLDIYKDITHISCDSNIPAKITCEGETGENFLDLAPPEDKSQVPVKLEGMTYQNLCDKNINVTPDSIYIDNTKNRYLFVAGEYTIKNTSSKKISYGVYSINSNAFIRVITLDKTTKVTLNKDEYIYNIVCHFTENWENTEASKELLKQQSIILKGDYTNKKIPNYSEGIKSVGEAEENKVNIVSKSKNLVEFIESGGTYGNIGENFGQDIQIKMYLRTNYIDVRNIKQLSQNVSGTKDVWANVWVFYDENKKGIYPYGYGSTVTVPSNAKYCRLELRGRDGSDISPLISRVKCMIVEGNEALTEQDYEPCKFSKRKLNLPIIGGLKGLPNGVKDVIEKRKDGYYLVQRVTRTRIDDSTNIGLYNEGVNSNRNRVTITVLNIPKYNYSRPICDKLPQVYLATINSTGAIGMDSYTEANWGYNSFYFNLDRSLFKFTGDEDTTQKLSKIKSWLKLNPIIVYHELSEPIEYKLNSTLVTNSKSAEFALEGQVDYKKAWNSGANLNKVALTGAYPYSTWLETSKSRIFSYELKEGEDATELLNVPLVPVVETLEGEKPLTQYSLSVLELLPDNKCLVRCNLDMVGGQGTEYYCVPSQFSSKICAKDVESLCKRVSLTGWDYNQVLEETLFTLLK